MKNLQTFEEFLNEQMLNESFTFNVNDLWEELQDKKSKIKASNVKIDIITDDVKIRVPVDKYTVDFYFSSDLPKFSKLKYNVHAVIFEGNNSDDTMYSLKLVKNIDEFILV